MGQTTSAVLYARVSSKEQEREGYSIDAQIRLLRDYARKEGIAVMQEFVDVETARKSGRTEFNKMLSFLKKNKSVETLLVEKTDRLYRNISDWVTIDNFKLSVHFVKENTVLSEDSRSNDKFMHGIKVLMAKNYVDNLSEETKKGMTEKAAQGTWPSCAPLGYNNVVGSDGKKTIQPDAEMAPLIRKAFEWYVTSNYSAKVITKKLKEAGLVYKKSGKPLPISTVHKMLRNRTYTGYFEWKGKIYAGKYEAIISEELWKTAQDILNKRNASCPKIQNHNFAFSGLIKCTQTGGYLVGEIKKGKYIYYRAAGAAGLAYVKEREIEQAFAEELKKLKFDDEVMAWIIKALKESHTDQQKYHEETLVRLQAEYKKLQNRIDAIYVDKLDGEISIDFFEKKSQEWRYEQRRIMDSIEQLEDASQSYITEGVQLLELVQKAYDLFIKQSAMEKRRLLNFMVQNSFWDTGSLRVEWKQPFDMLMEFSLKDEVGKVSDNDNLTIPEKWLPGQDSNLRPID